MVAKQKQLYYILVKYGEKNKHFDTDCSTIDGALIDFGTQLGTTLSLVSSGHPDEIVYTLLKFEELEAGWASKVNVYGNEPK